MSIPKNLGTLKTNFEEADGLGNSLSFELQQNSTLAFLFNLQFEQVASKLMAIKIARFLPIYLYLTIIGAPRKGWVILLQKLQCNLSFFSIQQKTKK